MAQTSILSFFTSKNAKENSKQEQSNGCSDGDSPIKVGKNKRQRIVSSSSDDELESKVESKKSKITEKSPSRNKIIPELAKSEPRTTAKKDVAHQRKDDQSDKCNIIENLSENESRGVKKVGKSRIINNPKITRATPKMEKDLNTESTGKSVGTDAAGYNPTTPKYHPISDACWNYGERVPYLALSRTLEEIEKTSARLKMIELLSNYLRSVLVLSPDDFLASVYLCLNKIGPAYEGLELGLAEQTLIRAVSQSTGRSFGQIKADVQESGDLGIVAERSRSSQQLMFRPQPLTVRGVLAKFQEIAAMTGHAAVNKKISMTQVLLVACRGPEARFLIRSLNGKLRIGLAEQSVLQAIAQACATTPPGQSYPPSEVDASKSVPAETFKSKVERYAGLLKKTYCECPNYELIIPVLLSDGMDSLPAICKMRPGIPVKPMLAQPTKGVQEVLTRFDGLQFTCEWKYDGERAQIHYLEDGTIKIYSRNLEDNTTKYPDIISRLKSAMNEDTKSFILDCEAVAWNKEEKRILPFQILSTRKRKGASEADIKVQVCVFMFDLLYLNGVSLVNDKFADRRRLLREHFKQVEEQWHFATAIDTNSMEEVQEFLEDSIKGHCEGLMVKTLQEDATYEVAKRSRKWLKLKKDYLEGVGDTLDLVVMGGYLGKGKRTGTYGGFLLGAYDPDSEDYQTLCKIGTGFSDENLVDHTAFLKEHVVASAPAYYQYDPSLEPDAWFAPVQVWEIKCADLSLSPVHRAAIGLVEPEKGISLRFPRFLRVREDKKPEEATSAHQVASMYRGQEQVQGQTTAFTEEDFY